MKLRLCYFQKYNNWGDALNPYLLHRLTGCEITACTNVDRPSEPHLLAIGSILQWANVDSVVWGTGVISAEGTLPCSPRRILSVRGPLTREFCRRSGMHCPAVYGDPALLMPEVYQPRSPRGDTLGVIPHYVDRNSAFVARCRAAGLTVIDVFSDIESFVDQVVSCSGILSSSLHGLICADAYGVPSRWIRISDAILGDGFKFRDYYASLGLQEEPVCVDGDSNPRNLATLPRAKPLLIDRALMRETLLNYLETC
ncbi:MAG: polysaccharide pyruvyl transferase family protein [Thermoguttaceae bacterium]|jgi:pyruvyltransferase